MLSPAKINLGLSVHHRRPTDGYHYLTSIFLPVSFGDTIEFRPSDRTCLVTENLLFGPSFDQFEEVSERGDPSKNILIKTIALLRESSPERMPEGIEIHLKKMIPAGAGLGGGSSNAGSLLRYLKERCSIPTDQIERAAIRAGADVPFFLHQKPMVVSGTGEIMAPVQVGPGVGLLCLPPVTIQTVAAYTALKRALHPEPPPEMVSWLSDSARAALVESRWGRLAGLTNDFEEGAFEIHPLLRRIKEAFLESGASYASLSGSGSALYALCETREDRELLLQSMRDRFQECAFHPFEILL